MQYHEQIPGWFDYANVYDHAIARASSGAVFVEVGAYLGRSTTYLASAIKRSGKKIRLYVVDLWDGWFYDDYRQQTPMPESQDVFWHFMRNVRGAGVDDVLCPLKMPSEKAATLFEDGTLDFVYVDADHGYEAVRRDLASWFPKVKRCGIFAGHDYVNNDFPGVRRAVDEFFAEHKLSFQIDGTSFWTTKPSPRWLNVAARANCQLVPVR
jgi:hypothetical protein